MPRKDVKEYTEEEQRKVIAQYEAIRQSGLTNMFNAEAVQLLALKYNFSELYKAIREGAYGSLLKNYTELLSTITAEDVPAVKETRRGEKKTVDQAVDSLLCDIRST